MAKNDGAPVGGGAAATGRSAGVADTLCERAEGTGSGAGSETGARAGTLWRWTAGTLGSGSGSGSGSGALAWLSGIGTLRWLSGELRADRDVSDDMRDVRGCSVEERVKRERSSDMRGRRCSGELRFERDCVGDPERVDAASF